MWVRKQESFLSDFVVRWQLLAQNLGDSSGPIKKLSLISQMLSC